MKAATSRLLFTSREEFRTWLSQNAQTSGGVWLVFGKSKKVCTLSSNDALEEALCFGWIDGQIQSVDEDTYIKYFKQRSEKSKWSEKNKSLTQKLASQGLMTDLGKAKIDIAKRNGSWDAPKNEPITDEQVRNFEILLKPHETAWANFEKMPRSSRNAYTASYIFTKTEDGRQKRLNTIITRLNLNLNPMERLKNTK
ncbi:MAG: hypothetical protein GX111_12635 [Clostridiales bacterium]|jgi:uncharacterized protein YdeI (YjbR/CyaY-like superfamily)|nr:hypothetical protein [Clostridiales bacterium]